MESLKRGDIIAVHLGEKICIDGRVIEGHAAVNQASITGESNPAMKKENSTVYAGTVVEAGSLVIRVEKVGADTSLAQIVHLVEEAQTRRAPVQNFADAMANLLVPISFIGAAIVYGATKDWQRVLNLLFIDFPVVLNFRRQRPFPLPLASQLGEESSLKVATILKTWPISIRSSSIRRAPLPWAFPKSTTSKRLTVQRKKK